MRRIARTDWLRKRRRTVRRTRNPLRDAAQSPSVADALIPMASTESRRPARERALARGAVRRVAVRLVPLKFAAFAVAALPLPAWSTTGGPAMGTAAALLLGAASLGALIALAGVVLSQQHRARRELNAMRQSLAAAAAWSWRTDANGVVVDIERSHRSIEWFDCRALIGRRPWELLPDTPAPAELAAACAARAPYFDVRLQVAAREGSPVHVLGLSAAPMFSGTGKFLGYAGAAHDLTPLVGSAVRGEDAAPLRAELEQAQRQLAERGTQLDHAQRELDSFAYSVSHDLRAPLRVVDGFATIVLEDYGDRGKPLDDLGRDHLRRIVAASQRMNSMIETLLSLSRMTSRELTRERVDLTQIARELVDDLRAQEPARAIEFVIAPALRTTGDATLLRLVLQNLLGNAWKFTAKVTRARIEFGLREEDGRAVYYVKDNGAGFDMRFAEKLFGLFQRLHSANEFDGTGVGLATVQKIVRRHGGRIWAEAIAAPGEGHGATFYFTLWE